jgi:uncharacterized Zn-binding protein involved in type VI secretion
MIFRNFFSEGLPSTAREGDTVTCLQSWGIYQVGETYTLVARGNLTVEIGGLHCNGYGGKWRYNGKGATEPEKKGLRAWLSNH